MRKAALMAVLAAVGVALWAQGGIAQNSDIQSLKKEMDSLKEGMTSIQKDLAEIKNLLKSRPPVAAAPSGPPPPPQEAIVGIEGSPFKGKKDARVVLVDFTDYQ